MKRYLRFLVVAVVSVLALCGVAFGALTGYYRKHFPVNTWVNGVYCTGKTVGEVNNELKQNYEASVVIITDANRAYWEIDMQEAEMVPDFEESLHKFLQSNARIFWTKWLQKTADVQIQADSYSFNEEKLRECLEDLEFFAEEAQKKTGVAVQFKDGEYFLCDGNVNRLDKEQFFERVEQALLAGNTNLLFEEVAVYIDLEDSDEDKAQRELWDKLNQFADCKLIYDMGAEQIAITAQDAIDFLKKEYSTDTMNLSEVIGVKQVIFTLDENGNFIVDENAVNFWVEELAAKYNTCGTVRAFQSTRGDIVDVSYVKYGTELDVDAEKTYLLSALSQSRAEREVHVPVYKQQGFVRGLDDIGGTYIEIDLTEQKMYYYKDGELLLETAVVTGDVQDDMETPEGINYVYNKQRNRTLRGPGYASFVKYWMPVNGGVGIHDASWRSKFGGEIYLKNGSHGCINTPSDIMDDFYEVTEVGTPVIMFH